MDKKRAGRPKTQRDSSPPAHRTRSKSPARARSSGRDSAPLKRGRVKKTDTPTEEVSSSSQSSTPKKQLRAKKEKPAVKEEDSENEEIASINSIGKRRSNRIATQIKSTTTPTPTLDNAKRSTSRAASSLIKDDSDDENGKSGIGFYSKPWFNAALLIILIELPCILHLIAAQGSLNWKAIWGLCKNPATFINLHALLIIWVIRFAVIIISILPFGRVVSIADRSYKFNGILSAVIILSVLIGIELKNGSALSLIFANLDRFLYVGVIKNLITAVVVYLHAKYRPTSVENSYGQSGRLLNDFTAGRELNPAFLKRIDVKRALYNESIIYLLIINVTLLFKNISVPAIESASEGSPIKELIKQTYNNLVFVIQNSEYNASALVISTFLIIYALDALIYEHHLAASFQVNDEGCGAELLLRFASFPFLVSLLPRFLLAQNVEACNCGLVAIGLCFVFGMVVKRCSNCLKFEYRLQPADPKFKGEL
jgi:voltage-gated potassium channel Kch